ncbi:hypothetical protein D3C85_1397040 [compost metagenome]
MFELRAGLVQDVFPPSIHPGTGKPYTWRTPPNAADGLPTLTKELLSVWQNWDFFKRDAEAACPWAIKPTVAPAKAVKRPAAVVGQRPSVIDEFNRCHDVEELLRTHGYIKRGSNGFTRRAVPDCRGLRSVRVRSIRTTVLTRSRTGIRTMPSRCSVCSNMAATS